MFPNISPFSVSHSENTPRHMRLKDALARCCLHSLWLTQSEVHGTTTHSLVVQHNRSNKSFRNMHGVQQLGILVELMH